MCDENDRKEAVDYSGRLYSSIKYRSASSDDEPRNSLCVERRAARDAHVETTVFYADRGPVAHYSLVVSAERTKHVRFNDLKDPATIPADTDFASLYSFCRADSSPLRKPARMPPGRGK